MQGLLYLYPDPSRAVSQVPSRKPPSDSMLFVKCYVEFIPAIQKGDSVVH